MAVEKRVKRYLHFRTGGKDGELPEGFTILQELRNERRDGRSQVWYTDSEAPLAPWVPVIENLTRREVSKLISDLADWLAWTGED